MSAVVIQPIHDVNNRQIIPLLDNSSSSSSSQDRQDTVVLDEQVQKQQILEYLSKTSPTSSYTTKRVPRLGQFLLLKTLGVGEFGKVKMARHFETGQIVAVKLVKKENIDSSSQLEKIRMEIDILKTLNHPYIVKLLSVNETHTCIGMVLEYAQGGELFEYIYRQRYLKEQEARRLFSQLISSVYYMHQKNIVHRDLKLENILLDCNGNLIVTDFGFANQFTQKTGDLMSTSCGSPVYAAPELVMTGRLYAGTGVDIWSCGIILYAMLCGYLPFDDDIKNPNGDNIGRLYRYIMANKPKYPDHLSFEAKDIIGKMLIPDPSIRCTIQDIMAHSWLDEYKNQISKSMEELETEAQYLKKSLLKGIESVTIQDDYVEDVCCDEDDEEGDVQSSACSTASSVSSSYSFPPSYSNTKAPSNNNNDNDDNDNDNDNDDDDDTAVQDQQQQQQPVLLLQHESSPPNTPIPYSKDMNSLSTTIEEFPTTEKLTSRSKDVTNEQSASKSTNLVPNERLDDAVVIPVLPPCKIQQSTNKLQQPDFNISSSSSLKNNNNTKRNTIGTSPTPTKKPSVPMQRQHSSLRAKLLSSVKRRNPSSIVINKEDSTVKTPAPQDRPTTKENKNRHSWQHIMQRHNNNNLPLSPPSSPITPEHSKSVRLISWLKNKSNANRKPSGGNPVNSRSSPVNSSSTTTSSHREEEVVVMIPVARPSVSLLPLQSNTRTTTTDLARNNSQVDKVSIESELRVHAGDMNRSALTSKPPMEVLLEINKILLLLGIEVENGGGYKLNCVRRSTVHYQAAAEDDEDDMMNHLSTNHQPILSQPIYGHPNIDSGQEIEFTIEICRFQNLSGLFSVDIQYVSEDNYAAYQFIGQKLLGLLHMGNIIRNTNFNIMLSKNEA